MRDFKKAILSTVCFMCMLAILSVIAINPYINSEYFDHEDANLRRELAGTVDLLVSGASHAMTGFDTNILDRKLDCNSYNLSSSMATLYGRYELLKKELSRNPVKTVIIEVSYDTLTRNPSEEYTNGDSLTLERLDSFGECFTYTSKYFALEDYLNLYSRALVSGAMYWFDNVRGASLNNVDYSSKGFHGKKAKDVELKASDVISSYNKDHLSVDYRFENTQQLKEIIELCRSYNTKIIIAVVPLPNTSIWAIDGWDTFYDYISDFCDSQDLELYDFNLLKDRYNLFNDNTSFKDRSHLSSSGAEIFTEVFCDVIENEEKGNDISDLFYNSYSEMKNDSPYMKVYNNQKVLNN